MPDLSDTVAKCRMGTAKFFTLLLLLYLTQAKVRGMKRAYQELANYYDGRALDKSEMLGIAHADNEEGAQALIALLRDKGFTGECLNVVYEPVTGAHVGPGTVALFFYGKEK